MTVAEKLKSFKLKPGDQVYHLGKGKIGACDPESGPSQFSIIFDGSGFYNDGKFYQGDQMPTIIPIDLARELGFVAKEPLKCHVTMGETLYGGQRFASVRLGVEWIGKSVQIMEITEPKKG